MGPVWAEFALLSNEPRFSLEWVSVLQQACTVAQLVCKRYAFSITATIVTVEVVLLNN
jgi:hypothetical protein